MGIASVVKLARVARVLVVSTSGSSYLDGVPVLAGEGVDGLLLETLLALGQSLVPMMKTTISALSPLSFFFLFFLAGAFRDRRIGRGRIRRFGAEVGTIDSLANSHLCEVVFSKTDNCRWSGGWKGGERKYWTSEAEGD